MHIDYKTEFLEAFIEASSLFGINQATLDKVSTQIYHHPKGYIADFYFGLTDVIKSIEETLDNKLTSNQEILNIKSVTEKIKLSLYLRVTSQGPIFARMLHNYYKTLQGIQIFYKIKFRTSDVIWRLAGDKSLDFNYYSKRILLFNVYTKSLHNYAITNNIEETKVCIDTSIENTLKLSRYKPSLILEKIPFIRLLVK
ncbi:MAG: hypothetical protein SFT68_05690 [Rickettsiaceae bacterium]|nr:hypothetical protein [Rickettsiaceae bacterium]